MYGLFAWLSYDGNVDRQHYIQCAWHIHNPFAPISRVFDVFRSFADYYGCIMLVSKQIKHCQNSNASERSVSLFIPSVLALLQQEASIKQIYANEHHIGERTKSSSW